MKNSALELEKDWDATWRRGGTLVFIVRAGRRFYNIFFERLLLRYATPETLLIELGSGTSSLAFLIATRIREYHGTDISPAIVSIAQKEAAMRGAHNVSFSIGDCRDLPDEHKNKYDIAWSQGLLEHFDDPRRVLASHIDAIKPGGVVLASVPARYSIHHAWYTLTRPKLLQKFWPWTEQTFFSKKSLSTLAAKTGLPYKVYWLPVYGMGVVFGILILEIKK